MKRIISLILLTLIDLFFMYLTTINLMYSSLKTIKIKFFEINLTGNGINYPLLLVTLILITITIICFFRKEPHGTINKKNQ